MLPDIRVAGSLFSTTTAGATTPVLPGTSTVPREKHSLHNEYSYACDDPTILWAVQARKP